MRSNSCGAWLLIVIGISTGSPLALAQTLVGTVNAGVYPVAVAANVTTNKVYVSNECGTDPSCQSTGTVTMIDGATNQTTNIPVGFYPYDIRVNPVTNKIYDVELCGNDPTCQSVGTVTVIDGPTNGATTLPVGFSPFQAAVNAVTNTIFVSNGGSNSVTVINGATNHTSAIAVGSNPTGIVVDTVTNKIYVANYSDNTVTIIDGVTLTTTQIAVGVNPFALAVNSVTNTIYVANQGANSVTVIDGATNHTTALQVDLVPYAIAVNQVTNQIYVANSGTDTVTDIDGATLNTTSITVGNSPSALAVNPITNDIYVANYADGTMTMIGGANNDTNTVPVGNGPLSVETNVASNRVYIGNESDGTVSVYAGSSLTGIQFVPVAPCRLVDTRDGNPIQGGTSKSFPITQVTGCEIPATALAYSLNVTLVPIHNGPVGYLTIWPTGEDQPLVSTMNSPDGRIKANAAIVPAGYESDVSVYVTNTTNILLDIDGYFAAPGASTLQFYPLTPCRVVDTRNPSGPLGGPFLNGGQERDFPVLESSCVPQGVNAQAYSMNFTVVPVAGEPLGYLTVWPAGQQRPTVSTLNNPTSTVVANAGIVPAGTSGEVATYPDQNTQLVIDIDGYFAAPAQGGLSLYPTVPCRALDTRNGSGAFNGELTVNVVGSSCAPPSTGRAYVFNATVIPGGSLGYLTLWPDGEQQPVVSTLNALDGKVTSNMAIVPSSNGSIDAYASGLTQLILDISSYFGP